MKIESLTEYIVAINKLKNKYTFKTGTPNHLNVGVVEHIPQFIFRGHSDDIEFDLCPGIFRWKKDSSRTMYSQMEANILNDFISDACRYSKATSNNDYVAWLEIAQHFGVPTRLLDFTSNPLVALYFACAENFEKDASVWIINESAYKRLFFEFHSVVDSSISNYYVYQIINTEIMMQDYQDHSSSEYVQYPWIYKPFCREERMSSQSSVFMLWGAKRSDFLSFVEPHHYMVWDDNIENQQEGFICKIIIEAKTKVEILKELDSCGINEKFIFPGLDGIGKYIKYKYSDKG